ncbi:venom serine protease-like [Anthonomus grandis grandis]|uniref:venom serine protease-like n=1 Tax=Anthonomus grandis grandis TaxID=2921223 RepID=UPI0021668CFA|nr:venom serine protease-like [Anthonomus grandis grandis]
MANLSRFTVHLLLVIFPLEIFSIRNCGFNLELVPGEKYFLVNPNYPNKYSSATRSIWNLKTVNGAQIFLSCTVNLPGNNNICYGDRLSVSARESWINREKRDFCGNSMFSLYSSGTELSVELYTTSNSIGGTFICTATPLKKNNPDEPPQKDPEDDCNCGWKSLGKIAGGVETGVNEFPFMAALIYNGEQWCGTTIISAWHTLTAAHCVIQQNLLDVNDLQILVGDHNLNTGSDTNQSAIYSVNSFIYHNAYDPLSYDNDIAILTTKSRIIFGFGVAPICLPFKYSYDHFVGQEATLLGWGLSEISGQDSPYLQKAKVDIVSPSICADEWRSKLDTHVNSGKICTFSDTSDACTKDSGGPLLWYDSASGRYQQIGIISTGISCNSAFPSINTRITEYLQWIVTQTSGIRYCVI